MLRKIIHRMTSMCPQAWLIFINGIRLTAILLLISVVFLCRCGELTVDYCAFITAHALFETGQAVLLITVILSAVVEDYIS